MNPIPVQLNEVTIIGGAAVLAAVAIIAGWIIGRRTAGEPAPETADRPDAAVRFESIMQTWQRITRAAEGTLLDNLAATTPYLATFIPATIAYKHTRLYLDFSRLEAATAALVVEFLGLAAVHTAFQLWSWNATKNKSDEEAPVKAAILVGVVYLLVIIVTNVLLEAASVSGWSAAAVARIVAKALLSILSVVAAFVLALRAQHARRQNAKQDETAERQRAAELGQARRKVAQLETKLEQMAVRLTELETETAVLKQERDNLKQERDAVKQERDNLKQAQADLKQAETAVKQIGANLEQVETELETLKQKWNRLPADVRAAVAHEDGAGSLRELAEEFGTNPTAISRAKAVLQVNGNGNGRH